jgi:shikimate dehydrogenase
MSVPPEAPPLPASRLTIGRDTTVCISLAGRPGSFGSRFHNYLFSALGLDWVYKAFTTHDLRAAVGGIRALGIRGCAVSMPFKEDCIRLLDELASSASAIQSVNTIVNDAGCLTGHNTDYAAIRTLLSGHGVPTQIEFALRGSGGMAKAVAFALRDAGFRRGTIVARNVESGRALANACGFDFRRELGASRPGLLINVTPIGMAGGPDVGALAFPPEAIASAAFVFDVVAMPVQTPLIAAAGQAGLHIISGGEVIVLQATAQFELYTGKTPSDTQITEATRFALA